jgi:hypothetical protein
MDSCGSQKIAYVSVFKVRERWPKSAISRVFRLATLARLPFVSMGKGAMVLGRSKGPSTQIFQAEEAWKIRVPAKVPCSALRLHGHAEPSGRRAGLAVRSRLRRGSNKGLVRKDFRYVTKIKFLLRRNGGGMAFSRRDANRKHRCSLRYKPKSSLPGRSRSRSRLLSGPFICLLCRDFS